MDKIWYIDVEGRQEGPFDPIGLKNHPLFSPDALVWRAGMAEWVAVRYVPELQILFRDEEPQPEETAAKKEAIAAAGREEMTLALRFDPFSYLFWLMIALLLILYTFYQIVTSR